MSVSPMEELLGPKLLKGANSSATTVSLLKDTKLVALYFSAAWCPPCQKFSPILKEFYKNTSRQDIEIVYVSSDKSLDEFNEYYATMPWLAIPTDADSARIKTNLATKLHLSGIPTLVILEASTGLFVTNQARQQVYDNSLLVLQKDKSNASKKLVDTWLEQEDKVPLDQAVLTQPTNIVMQLIMAVLKNPMYMFAMLYLFKQVLKWIQGDQQAPETATPLLGQEDVVKDEF